MSELLLSPDTFIILNDHKLLTDPGNKEFFSDCILYNPFVNEEDEVKEFEENDGACALLLLMGSGGRTISCTSGHENTYEFQNDHQDQTSSLLFSENHQSFIDIYDQNQLDIFLEPSSTKVKKSRARKYKSNKLKFDSIYKSLTIENLTSLMDL